MHEYSKEPLWLRSLLWVLAVVLMLASVVYQKSTGPTYPRQGSFELDGKVHEYRLIRSDWSILTNGAAKVVLPDPGTDVGGSLYWKRFRTRDAFSEVPLSHEMAKHRRNLLEFLIDLFRGQASKPEEPSLVGLLPAQPAAGKLEYRIELYGPSNESVEIPGEGEDNVVIRFKDHVPTSILLPHILMMFFSVLIGMRAALAAMFAPSGMRIWSWTALIGMTAGGMVLGPIVQKYAFGDYWTGWPFGGDWTDNKMLIMWLSWVVAAAFIGTKPRAKDLFNRVIVIVATLVMMSVYLIPHSMGGSELDYEQVDQGIDPSDAIQTGKK